MPKDVKFYDLSDAATMIDKRMVGIGSYRGYYSDIAIYTQEEGMVTCDKVVDWGNVGTGKFDFDEWRKNHEFELVKLPTTAGGLYKILSELLDEHRFSGYKGGEFLIDRDKPLWFAETVSDCSDMAIISINDDLTFECKLINDEE